MTDTAAASTSLSSELEAAVSSAASAIEAAVSPIATIEATVKSVADAVDESAKVAETLITDDNTPAMISNKEATEEQAESDVDNQTVANAEAGKPGALEKLEERSS